MALSSHRIRPLCRTAQRSQQNSRLTGAPCPAACPAAYLTAVRRRVVTSWLCPSDGRIGDAVLIGQLTVLAGTEWTWTLNAQGKTSSLSENTWQEHGICISNTKDDRCAPPSKPRSIIMKPALSPSGRPASSALSPSLPRSIALLLYIRALVTPSALRLELRPAGGGGITIGASPSGVCLPVDPNFLCQ